MVITIAFTLLGLAGLLVFARLVRGPTASDRLLALDLMTVVAAAVIATLGISEGEIALVDAALVLALIGFVGSIAFARVIERRGRDG